MADKPVRMNSHCQPCNPATPSMPSKPSASGPVTINAKGWDNRNKPNMRSRCRAGNRWLR